MAAQRLVWIDRIRALGIIMVVTYHTEIALVSRGIDLIPGMWTWNAATSAMRMQIIIFVSGFLLERTLRKSWGVFLDNKLRTIAWPWFVWTSILAIFLVIGSWGFGGHTFGWQQVLDTYLSQYTYTWYLAYLFAFFVIARLLTPAIRAWSIPVLLVFAQWVGDYDGWHTRFPYMLALFFLGELVARHPRWWDVLQRTWVVALFVLVTAASLVAGPLGFKTWYTIWSVPGTVTFVAILVLLSDRITRPIGWLETIGREAIVFYASHLPFLKTASYLAVILGLGRWPATILILSAALGIPALLVKLRSRHRAVGWLYEWNPKSPPKPAPVP